MDAFIYKHRGDEKTPLSKFAIDPAPIYNYPSGGGAMDGREFCKITVYLFHQAKSPSAPNATYSF